MMQEGKQAVAMIYRMFKNGYTLHSRRAGDKLWVMYNNQYKGRTVAAVFKLEKRNAARTTEDIPSSTDAEE